MVDASTAFDSGAGSAPSGVGPHPRASPLVEHDELRWLDRADWHSVHWLDGDVPIVHALDRFADRPR